MIAFQDHHLTVHRGNALDMLKTLPDESHQMCVTSPPYWGLRSYLPKDHPDKPFEIGQEKTPEEYVARMVELFREVRRVLKKDGVLWLNLGDSYAQDTKWGGSSGGKNYTSAGGGIQRERKTTGLKPKDLVGIPWRVAFALQADGWWLRQDIIWAKPNCMPESVTDRCTRSHEYIFLLTKSERYFYDHEAIKEPGSEAYVNDSRWKTGSNGKNEKNGYLDAKAQNPKSVHRVFDKQRGHPRRHAGFNERWDAMTHEEQCNRMVNKRDVWWVSPMPFSDWVKTVRWVRVSMDASACGKMHIASLDCPIYGGLFDLLSTVLRGGHGDECLRHTLSTCAHLSPEPKPGFEPFEMLHAWNFGEQNLGSLLLSCFGIATPHSSQTHKTDLFVSTRLSCMPSAQRSSHILGTLAKRGLSEQSLGMIESNTWVDDFDANHTPETLWRIVGTHIEQDFSSARGWFYERKKRETSHFATFPPDLIRPCIRAGSKPGDTVLDPFGGSGTTAMVALQLGRKCSGIELNPDYLPLIQNRTHTTPGLGI